MLQKLVMKILYAKNKPKELEHFKLQLFNLNELILIPPENWLKKRMNSFNYDQSFSNNGILYPIMVSTHEPEWVYERFKRKNLPHIDENNKVKPGLYVQTGNKRVLWARENGYDQIEGYLVHNKQDKVKIRSITHIGHDKIPK
jgi:hypothetical protein